MNILIIIINFIQALIMTTFVNKCVTIKKQNNVFYLLFFSFIMTIFITYLNFSYLHEGIVGLFIILCFFLYTNFISSNSFTEKCLISSIPYILVGVINTTLLPILSLCFYQSLDIPLLIKENYYLVSTLVTLTLFIVLAILNKHISSIKLNLSMKYNFYFVLLIASINLVYLFFENMFFTKNINIYFLLLSFFALDLFIILAYQILKIINQNNKDLYQHQIEIDMLVSQLNNQKKILELEEKLYSLNHDIQHLIQLSEENKIPLISEKVLHKYKNEFESLPITYATSNPVLKYVFQNKKELAKNNNIDFVIYTNLYREISLDSTDLYLVLENLLQNAIDNCSGKKVVRLKLTQTDELLSINIRNSISKSILDSNPNLISTKGENGHGYGVKNVKNIVKKYNGEIIINEVDLDFIVNIELVD